MHRIPTVAAFITALVAIASSEELKASDVPQACTVICGPIVKLTNTCDIDPNGSRRRTLRRDSDSDSGDADEADEAFEAQCICKNTSFNVGRAALCAACLTQNGGETEDMSKIMSQCAFTSTSYVPAATSAVAGVTVVATKPAVPNNAGSSATKTPGSAGTSVGAS
ncbi:hypothetical protein QBC34DRAFT_382799 [Podospora aff. communis PSN243]|uniref:Uncharacterized protein n=1 Tax=Podospora aff. communis PSN243 TaxID=3040156 RepID=A0AAV9GES9_9PEZI|nr:hypothetical protein QBC34DRAFT_382799 [Podospora aff. communis PSN243]